MLPPYATRLSAIDKSGGSRRCSRSDLTCRLLYDTGYAADAIRLAYYRCAVLKVTSRCHASRHVESLPPLPPERCCCSRLSCWLSGELCRYAILRAAAAAYRVYLIRCVEDPYHCCGVNQGWSHVRRVDKMLAWCAWGGGVHTSRAVVNHYICPRHLPYAFTPITAVTALLRQP